MNKKRTGSKLVAVLAALLTAFAMTPQFAAPMYADDGDPAITYQTNVLSKNANQDGVQQVLYGGRSWYVIAYDGKDGDGNVITYDNPAGNKEQLHPAGTITLFQKGAPEGSVFHDNEDSPEQGYYYGYGFVNDSRYDDVASKLRQTIESTYLTGDKACFSEGEQEAITPRTLTGGCSIYYHDEHPDYDPNHIANKDLENALVWPLSAAEAENTNGAILGASEEYWLRTPGSYPYATMAYMFASCVNSNGSVDRDGDYVIRNKGVRPALYLNMQSVLLTSASVGGKVSGKTGPNALKAVTDNTDDEWILTVKDKAHGNFKKDSSAQVDCQTVEVQYSGAATGANEYISALVMDENNNVKQYGRIKNCASADDASGIVTISVKNRIEEGDSLYVFNEQCNGDEKTDFASEIWAVDVPAGGHKLTEHEAHDATCTDPGNDEYWECTICKNFFGDADGTAEIVKGGWIVPPKGHSPFYIGTKATPEAEGSIWQRCAVCNQNLTEPETIHCPKTVTLSDKTIIYDGKAKTPAVLIADTEGKIISSENYDVVYGNNVHAGTATVSIAFKGDFYDGLIQQPFTIMKAANTLKVKAKTVCVSASAVAKKNRILKVTKAVKFVNKGQGAKTYRKKAGNPKIKINPKNGAITIKKGLKAGTYKVKVEVRAKGNSNYQPSKWIPVIFKVVVK